MSKIHELRVGQIGVVAHELKHYVWNAWTESHDIGTKPLTPIFGYSPIVNNKPLVKSLHIPHGSLVLVLKEATLLPTAESTKENKRPFIFYYKVLWREEICWIEKKYLINPYCT